MTVDEMNKSKFLKLLMNPTLLVVLSKMTVLYCKKLSPRMINGKSGMKSIPKQQYLE